MVSKWVEVGQKYTKIPILRLKGGRKMSFVGSYSHSMDAKKRVFIPSKFRDDLGDEFYITRKFDAYLSIYTAEDWEAYVDKISKLPEADAEEFQDFILGAAQKCTPDSNGRIILDDRLLRHAKINKNIVFVGTGKQIRVWAEELWNEREQNRNYEKMRDIMRQYGL